MKNRDIKEILFFFILIFIMVFSLNLAVMDSTGMELPLAGMVTLTLCSVAAASLIVIFPVTLLLALAAAAGWAAYIYYAEAALLNYYLQEILGFFSWLYGYIVGYNYFEPAYSFLFAALYVILVSVAVSIIVYSGRGEFMLIVLGTAALSFFWFIYVEKARLYLVLFLFAAIILYSYQVYKKRLREWKSAGSIAEDNIGLNWMLNTAIVVSVSLLLSLALPLNISAVRWPWLNDKVVSMFPFIADWRNDTLESFSYGFNSRYSFDSARIKGKRLGGELLQDTSVMMTVKTQGEDTLYLRGAIKDKYSGNSWSKSKKRYKEYTPGYPLPLPFGSSVTTYEKTSEITYDGLLTSTIFAPYSVYQVQHESKRIYADEDSEVYTPKMTMRDEPYTVKSMLPYIDNEEIRKKKTESLGANEFKLYTSLTGDITERVKSLAQEITKGQNNNYDKAKAVEKYLRQNYQYTLKPGKLPSNAEFTDHFLFEGKEGYCTYFATSMAVLLRASNVPCRYVEGFIARYDGSEERKVRGTDAHAWVEVYFDDYGWVSFEPTPQYPVVEYRTAGSAVQEAETDTEGDKERDSAAISDLSRRRGSLEEMDEGGSGAVYEKRREKSFNIGNIIIFVFASLLIIRFCFMYFAWILREISLKRNRGRSFAMDYIKDVIWYLRRAGFVMKPEETLREFLKRVKYNYEERFSDIPIVTEILEKIRYSEQDLDTEERKTLEVFRKKVKRLALKKAGVIQFFVSLYILGR